MTRICHFHDHVENSDVEFRHLCLLQGRRVTKQVREKPKQGDKLHSSTLYLPYETPGWTNSYRVLYSFVLTPRQEFVAWRGVFEHLAWNWAMNYRGYIGEPYSPDAQEALSRRFRRTSLYLSTMFVLKSLLSVFGKRKNRFSGQWTKRRKYPQRVQYHRMKERSDLYIYVIKSLGSLRAIILVENLEIPAQGTGKVRLRQQYVDFVRHIEFYQKSGFQVQMSSHVQLFLDRDFYLPQNLSEDRERYRLACIQDFIVPHLKPLFAKMMIESFLQAGVEVLWVVANKDYGTDRSLFDWLRVQKIPYMLALSGNDSIGIEDEGLVWPIAASDVATEIPVTKWFLLGVGKDSKGDQLYEWAMEPVLPYNRLKVVEGLEKQEGNSWLLVRRSLTNSVDLAYYLVFSPSSISLEEIVQVARRKSPAKGFFEKNTGLVLLRDILPEG